VHVHLQLAVISRMQAEDSVLEADESLCEVVKCASAAQQLHLTDDELLIELFNAADKNHDGVCDLQAV
jgi:hypothetical protein